MAIEKLKEALVLVRKAQEAVEACLEEYGDESYEPEEKEERPAEPEDRMSKMLSMMGKRK